MNILLTNTLQIFQVKLQELYPSLNLQHRKCHCYCLLWLLKY